MEPKEAPALASDLQLTDFIDPESSKEIISSKTFPRGDWNQICRLKNTPPEINKRVIPVDARSYRILVVTTVAPNTRVPNHSHDEGVVRFITQGSLTLNDVDYHAGDWVFTPEGSSYEIYTSEGYTAVAGYGTYCGGDPN